MEVLENVALKRLLVEKYEKEVRSNIDVQNQTEAAGYKYFMPLNGKKRLRSHEFDSHEACSDLAILPHGIDY